MNAAAPPLSEAQLREFAREGCLVLPGAVDAATLAALRADFAARVAELLRRARVVGMVDGDGGVTCTDTARLPAWRELFGEDWRAEAGVFIPDSVYRLLTHPRLTAMARQILGADDLVASPVQHIRIKPPQRDLPAGADTDATVARANWHQDEAVVHEGARGVDILTVWVAATAATVENGCASLVAVTVPVVVMVVVMVTVMSVTVALVTVMSVTVVSVTVRPATAATGWPRATRFCAARWPRLLIRAG